MHMHAWDLCWLLVYLLVLRQCKNAYGTCVFAGEDMCMCSCMTKRTCTQLAQKFVDKLVNMDDEWNQKAAEVHP